jgi:hypothetical protein
VLKATGLTRASMWRCSIISWLNGPSPWEKEKRLKLIYICGNYKYQDDSLSMWLDTTM